MCSSRNLDNFSSDKSVLCSIQNLEISFSGSLSSSAVFTDPPSLAVYLFETGNTTPAAAYNALCAKECHTHSVPPSVASAARDDLCARCYCALLRAWDGMGMSHFICHAVRAPKKGT